MVRATGAACRFRPVPIRIRPQGTHHLTTAQVLCMPTRSILNILNKAASMLVPLVLSSPMVAATLRPNWSSGEEPGTPVHTLATRSDLRPAA